MISTKPRIKLLSLAIFLLSSIATPAQQAETMLENFNFSQHWGQFSLNQQLENYFGNLDRRDGWSAILFRDSPAQTTQIKVKGGGQDQPLVEYFTSGQHEQGNGRFREVMLEEKEVAVHWIVADAERIQQYLAASDFKHFFFTRPNEDGVINYHEDHLIIKSWQCWGSYKAFPRTLPIKGATILSIQAGKIVERWEWVDLGAVVEQLKAEDTRSSVKR